jgi:hypothetical protein
MEEIGVEHGPGGYKKIKGKNYERYHFTESGCMGMK